MKLRIDLAWIVLLGPLIIVVSVLLFEHTPWVKDQTTMGAQYEALSHVGLGRSAMKRGDYREAFGQYQTALDIDPENSTALMGLGILYNMRGDYDRAIAAMNKVLEIDSIRIERIYNNLGMVYATKKEYDTAIVMFQKSLNIDSTSVEVYRNIGEIVADRKNWKMAINAYSKAIMNKPTLRKLYIEMSREAIDKYKDEENYNEIYRFLNRNVTDELLTEFDAQIVEDQSRHDPKLANDYKNLAKSYAEFGKLDEAVRLYQSALQITPDDARIRNKLGILFARTDELAKALVQFKEAVRLDPGYDDAKYNLRRCEQKLANR